jgi:putative ABC transport system substrate-binding protein
MLSDRPQPFPSTAKASISALFLSSLWLILAVSATALAQTPAKIGILVQEMGRSQSQAIKGLNEELKRLGYRDRKNLFFETRDVKGMRAALQPATVDLLEKRVDLIFTTGTSATRAAMAATKDVPIVFIYPGNPIGAGIVKSAEERAKNLTGVAAYAGQTTEKRLAIIKEIVPRLQTIVIFYDFNNSFARDSVKQTEGMAKKIGLEAVSYAVKSNDELRTTLASLQAEKGMAIFQVSDELVETEAEFLFATARQKKLPTMFNEESWVVAGALAAYGPSYVEMGRQAARLAQRIFNGEKPEMLSIERAVKFDLTLNYRTASFIGVNLPAPLIKQANRVIR